MVYRIILAQIIDKACALSCVSANRPSNRRTAHSLKASGKTATDLATPTQIKEREDQAVHDLVEHLKSIAPFNKRWKVIDTINQGTYGVVFSVQDVVTKVYGVIKVAKSMANEAGNISAEWEGFILETMFKRMESASIVRLLDKGMLADQHGEGMEFVVLERANIAVKDYIYEVEGVHRKHRAAMVSLQMLKAIYDLHSQGLLHRDLKPDNMGLCSREQPVTLLFDLGMARMYTDGESDIRPPRTCCPFRGTPEWASGHAQKGREQTRFDDLISWLYVVCELFASEKEPTQPLPWTYRSNIRAHRYLKSIYCPARYLFRYVPQQFYSINAYLQTANRYKPPDYHFLAEKVNEVISELQVEVNKLPPLEIPKSVAKKESNEVKPEGDEEKGGAKVKKGKSKSRSRKSDQPAAGDSLKDDPKMKQRTRKSKDDRKKSGDSRGNVEEDLKKVVEEEKKVVEEEKKVVEEEKKVVEEQRKDDRSLRKTKIESTKKSSHERKETTSDLFRCSLRVLVSYRNPPEMKDSRKYDVGNEFFIMATLADNSAYDNYTTLSLRLYRADDSDTLIARKKFSWPEKCLPKKAQVDDDQTVILEGENNLATIPMRIIPGHSSLFVASSETSTSLVPTYKSFSLEDSVSQPSAISRLIEGTQDKCDEAIWNALIDVAKEKSINTVKLPLNLSPAKQFLVIKVIQDHVNHEAFELVMMAVITHNLITSAKASYKFVALLACSDHFNIISTFIRSSVIVHEKTYALCLKLLSERKSECSDLLTSLLEKPINRIGLAAAISMEMSEIEVTNIISWLKMLTHELREESVVDKILKLMSVAIDSHSQRFVWDDQCHQTMQHLASEMSALAQTVEFLQTLEQKLDVNEESTKNVANFNKDYIIRKINFQQKII